MINFEALSDSELIEATRELEEVDLSGVCEVCGEPVWNGNGCTRFCAACRMERDEERKAENRALTRRAYRERKETYYMRGKLVMPK